MSVRSRVAISSVLAIVVACGPTAQGAPGPTGEGRVPSDPPSPASVMPSQTAKPTPRPAPTPSPAPSAGPVVNADGSVRITTPTTFGLATPVDDAVWGVLGYGRERFDIVRFDPESYEIETVLGGLPVMPNPVLGVAVNGWLWVASWDTRSVTQYDATTGRAIREIDLGAGPVEPVIAYGDLWFANHEGGSVTRVDTEKGRAYPDIELPGARPLTITAVADDLLLVNGPQDDPRTWVIDPLKMKVVGTYETECYEARGSLGTAIDGLLWRKRCGKDEVAIVEPRTGKVLEAFDSPIVPYAPLYVDGTMWLPAGGDNRAGTFRLIGIDPKTREVRGTYEQPGLTEGSAFAAYDAWWRWGDEGLLRIPADTLREATR